MSAGCIIAQQRSKLQGLQLFIYANTVIAPPSEVKKSTPTTTKPRTTSKTPVKTTQPTQQEKSSVTERYNQAIATPTTTPPIVTGKQIGRAHV